MPERASGEELVESTLRTLADQNALTRLHHTVPLLRLWCGGSGAGVETAA